MLKIRLKRIGRRHDPSFRVVVTEATAPPKGKYKEAVGFYNAALKELKLNSERIKYWLSVGAQPTVSVHNLLVKEGVIDASKKRAHSTRVRKSAQTPQPAGAGQADTDKEQADADSKSEEGEEAKSAEEQKSAETSDKEESRLKEEAPAEEEVKPEAVPVQESAEKEETDKAQELKKTEEAPEEAKKEESKDE